MTDVNAQPASADPIPASDFDENFESFMGFKFSETPPGEEEVQQDPPAKPVNGEPAPTKDAPAGDQQPKETLDGGEAGDTVAAGEAADEIDPAALMEMLAGKPAAKTTEEVPAEGQPDAEPETFRPFANPIGLAPATIEALFEAEDTGTRAAALGALLQGMGNAITAVVEKRIAEFHAPKIQAEYSARAQQETAAKQVQETFYSEANFAYLRPYQASGVVGKAFDIIAAKHPDLTFEQAMPKVGALARAFIKQSTGKDPGPVAVQPQTTPNPKPKPPGSFAVGGARVQGAGDPVDPNSPEGILEGMTF